MVWRVLFHDEFEVEFDALEVALQDELLAHAQLLQDYGPNLGRPTVDTLKGAPVANLKELRFQYMSQVWRVAFAFDPKRQAILLVAGDKAGVNQKLFYKRLMDKACKRYASYTESLNSGVSAQEKNHGKKSR
jgi:hypothetical protein